LYAIHGGNAYIAGAGLPFVLFLFIFHSLLIEADLFFKPDHMKYIFPVLFVCTLFTLNSKAQSWFPAGSGTNDLVNSLCVYNDTLYAAGWFTNAGGFTVNGIARWDGLAWHMAGSPSFDMRELVVYNNELYGGGTQGVLKWNGSAWIAAGTNAPAQNVTAMAVHDGKLYVAASDVYQFDIINNWNAIANPFNTVNSLCSYNGSLYAGGSFTFMNQLPMQNLAKWDGLQWSSPGPGVPGGIVFAMDSYNNELYVGGYFSTSSGNVSSYLMKWNDTAWSAVGTMGRVLCIDSLNGHLFVGGDFSSAGGVTASRIAYYDGTNWMPVGAGVNMGVTDIAYFQNAVYAGGAFTSAGGSSAAHIAYWNGLSGITEREKSISINLFPNPFYQATTLHSDAYLRNSSMSIRNSLGQEVRHLNGLYGHDFILEENLPAGLYSVLLFDGKELIASRKILILEL
jgi:hypothetical protein